MKSKIKGFFEDLVQGLKKKKIKKKLKPLQKVTSITRKFSNRSQKDNDLKPTKPSVQVPEPDIPPRTSDSDSPTLYEPLAVPGIPAAQRLPQEVFECINTHLRELYTNASEASCESCILATLCSASKVCQNWRDGLIPVIYRDIYLTSPNVSKKSTRLHQCRISLLRRTLSTRPDYAIHCTKLTLPPHDPSLKPKDASRIESNVSALIRHCPNLRSLSGLHTPFTGSESPIHTALATRQHLREHLWLVSTTTPLQFTDSQSFVSLHRSWRSLETLVMQGATLNAGGGGLNHLTFADIFAQLPSLKKLMISRFQAYEFNDHTLLSIPRSVTHLRLGKLPGLTAGGLMTFSQQRRGIHTLALLELELQSMTTIAAILKMPLKKLTFLQTSSPSPALLVSGTLEWLHWDVLRPGPATGAVAASIVHGHLSALRSLRAPADRDGVLQGVCRPVESILLPYDTLSPGRRGQTRLLPLARIEAERRILEARERAFVSVLDKKGYDWMGWNGSARLWRCKELQGGWMGDPRSGVEYTLRPDVKGSREAVAKVADVLGNRGGRRKEEDLGLGILF
ncbi:hypothetical protein BZA77DRAFT_301425 [Pyronema omphalodes]|nr:hypothetical protein BZA77DRAFT_301425 [Pyronema omphalodes]